MISRRMFDDVFLPGIVQECRFAQASIYHLDGPGALRHLDSLLSIPELNAIQWVYGAGNGPMTKWLDLLKEIQGYGIGLHLGCEPNEVETILTELSSKGLYIRSWAKDIEEGEELIKLAEKLSHE